MPNQHRLFVAFEGGGAKGIVHIGALAAIESRNFTLERFAGTSSGAIIAALKASGYDADEIINPVTRRTIFDRYAEISGSEIGPTDLFGKLGWPTLKTIQYLYRRRGAALFLFAATIFAILVRYSLTEGLAVAFHLTAIVILAVGAIFFASASILSRRRGIVSGRLLRSALNTLIADKVFPDQPNKTVTLGDLKDSGRPSLRIVTADVTNRKLRLFSSDNQDDANIPVADAVVASICLPYIFRPWRIDERMHVDGAIVSNLPAWPFDEERALDLDAQTVAFEINTANGDVTGGWLRNLIETATFGAAVLNKRGVDRLTVIPLMTELGLLDFDAPMERIIQAVNDARAATDAQIIKRLIEQPQLYTDACVQANAVVSQLLVALPQHRADLTAGRTRVALAFQEPGLRKSLRLLYSNGFADDADEGIILPIDGSVIGEAWTSFEPVLKTAPFQPLIAPVGYRRLNKLFARDIRWICAIPIARANRPEPSFVVAVDGSATLVNDTNSLESLLDVIYLEIAKIFTPIAEELGRAN